MLLSLRNEYLFENHAGLVDSPPPVLHLKRYPVFLFSLKKGGGADKAETDFPSFSTLQKVLPRDHFEYM